jgi:hypothetical protein
MKSTVRLTKADADTVHALRLEAYRNSPVFTVRDPQALRWDEQDESGLVLGVRDAGGSLLSTMRGVIVDGRDRLEHLLEGGLPEGCRIGSSTRTMFLERAATRAPSRKLGLNSLLRWYLLDVTVRCGAAYLVGVLDRGASRTDTLRRMGYRFAELRLRESYAFPSKTQAILAWLDLHGESDQAVRHLQNACSSLIQEYPLVSDLGSFVERWKACATVAC